MDFGGLPPISTVSFWQFFWPSFRVPDFQGRFEALNNIFRALHKKTKEKVRF
jgi:hypothetical protein